MKALVVEPSKMYQLLLNEFLNGFSISHEVVTTGEAALIEFNLQGNNNIELSLISNEGEVDLYGLNSFRYAK